MISITTVGASEAAGLFLVINLALLGAVKKTILDTLLQTVGALKERIKTLEDDTKRLGDENKTMKGEMQRMRAEGEMTSKQLAASLRVIEYFERIITVVVKGRPRLPEDLAAQIDKAMSDLARFREQATLDIESLEVNRSHYDWLLAREAIMGPARDAPKSST